MTPAHAPLTELEFELFRRLIRDRFGLDYPPQRRELLGHKLARRLADLRLRTFAEYYHLLRFEASPEEWRGLADAVTNNETYFFRERAHLEELGRLVESASADAPLRVLSAGCSSGEEPYGMAMVIAARIGVARAFEVVGLDVSSAKLAEARGARYQERSFRAGQEPPSGVEADRFFCREADGAFAVLPAIRAKVTLRWGNLADASTVAPFGKFDIVFCRNILIYANVETMPRFVASLADVVRPGGYLFLGHSETLLGHEANFRATRMRDHFAYVRKP